MQRFQTSTRLARPHQSLSVVVFYAHSLPTEDAESSRPTWDAQGEGRVEQGGRSRLEDAKGRGSEGWRDETGWAGFQAAFFCWSTDPLAMNGEEIMVDEEKVHFLDAASRRYASMDCASKGNEESEKCFLIRGTVARYSISLKHALESLKKCDEFSIRRDRGTYASCLADVAERMKGLVEENYERLEGLGISPSS